MRSPRIVPLNRWFHALPPTRPVTAILSSSPRSLVARTVRSRAPPPTVARTVTAWNSWPMSNVQRPPCCGTSRTQRPRASAGTIQRWIRDLPPRPTGFSGVRSSIVSSGSHSRMFQSCDTRRVPGASVSSFGRSLRLTSGSRYMVTTDAFERSVSKRSCEENSVLSATPAAAAFSRPLATSVGSMSMPSAFAPRFAAPMTMRPSPEPRSIT